MNYKTQQFVVYYKKTGEIIFKGIRLEVCDFLMINKEYFYELNTLGRTYSTRFKVRPATWEEERLNIPKYLTYEYAEEAIKKKEELERLSKQRDYNFVKGRANRYRDSHSVRFSPL